MIESHHQQALVRWFGFAHRGLGVPSASLLMAFPLQAVRSTRNGARMKAEGARKGTPDLFLAVSRGGCHGLFIEMKTETGRVSPEQTDMLALLRSQGYGAVVARGFDEAHRMVEAYLKSPAPQPAEDDPFPHHD